MMTVKITHIDKTVLKVEGKLTAADAEMLEQAAEALENGERITIDVSDVSFIDNNAAAILVRLERKKAELKGVDFFIQAVIDAYTNER